MGDHSPPPTPRVEHRWQHLHAPLLHAGRQRQRAFSMAEASALAELARLNERASTPQAESRSLGGDPGTDAASSGAAAPQPATAVASAASASPSPAPAPAPPRQRPPPARLSAPMPTIEVTLSDGRHERLLLGGRSGGDTDTGEYDSGGSSSGSSADEAGTDTSYLGRIRRLWSSTSETYGQSGLRRRRRRRTLSASRRRQRLASDGSMASDFSYASSSLSLRLLPSRRGSTGARLGSPYSVGWDADDFDDDGDEEEEEGSGSGSRRRLARAGESRAGESRGENNIAEEDEEYGGSGGGSLRNYPHYPHNARSSLQQHQHEAWASSMPNLARGSWEDWDDDDGDDDGPEGAAGAELSLVYIPGISSVWSSTVAFANTIAAPANPLNLPIAARQSGLIMYPLLTALFAVMNAFTCNLLASAIDHVGTAQVEGFAELMAVEFGRVGWQVGAWCIILGNFGSLVYTMVLIGDLLVSVLGVLSDASWICNVYIFEILVAVFVLVPLSMVRNMGKLDSASSVAVCILVAFVLLMIVFAIYVVTRPDMRDHFGGSDYTDHCTLRHTHFHDPGSEYRLFPDSIQFLAAFSNLSFSFNAQANVFPLYHELRRRSPRRMAKVNARSMIITGGIFIFSGVFGYMTFLDATKADVILNFPVRGTWFATLVNVLRFLLTVTLVISYPLTLWECRAHLEQMVARRGDSEQQSSRKRFVISVIIIALSTVIAATVNDVATIFGFFGATAAPAVVAILPGFLHLKLRREDYKRSGRRLCSVPLLGTLCLDSRRDWLALAVFLFGVLLVPLALYEWVTSIN